MEIVWYPGHMAKAKRLLLEQLKRVDAVLELCDARIPFSSRNPDLQELAPGKPRLLLLNKMDLADPGATKQWLAYFQAQGETAFAIEAGNKSGMKRLPALIQKAAEEKLSRAMERGYRRTLRCMVIGVPNVGKSTLINALAPKSRLKAEDRPGVTRASQWVKVDDYLELLDTPGMLWPRLDDVRAARRLAFIAAVRDEAIDTYHLSIHLLDELMDIAPSACVERFKIKDAALRGEALLHAVCHGRGFLLKGAEPDLDRAVSTVLTDFREGRLGRLTFERPEAKQHE